jgi:hypothetical protein
VHGVVTGYVVRPSPYDSSDLRRLGARSLLEVGFYVLFFALAMLSIIHHMGSPCYSLGCLLCEDACFARPCQPPAGANTYLVFTSLGSDDIRSSHRFVRWIPLGICCPQRAILLLYTLSRYLIDATPKDRPRTNFCRSRTFLFMPPRLYMPSLYCPFLRPHSILEQYHNQY